MYLTNYSEGKILSALNGTTAVAPTTMYAALFLSNPGETGTGTEIAYTGYARKPISFSAPTADGSGKVKMANSADVVFPVSDVVTGNITYLGLMDALTGGNMWAYMLLDEPVQVRAGVAPIILAQEWGYESSGDFSIAFKQKYMSLFRGVNLPGFTAHMALYNGNPDDGGSELSGLQYARFPIAFSAPAVQPSGESMIANSASVTSPRAGESWGTLSYTAIMDNLSGGALVAFKLYDPAITINRGDAVFISPGSFSIRLN
jgi:hypothetical protein